MSLCGQINHHTKVTLRIIKFTAWEYILGRITGNIMENGRKIKWMVKENIDGQTGDYTLVNSLETRNTVSGFSHNLTAEFTKEVGNMGNKMV